MDIQLELANLKNFDTLLYEFKEDLNHYLQTVKGCTKMTSLSDIISFNERHADQCLAYGQNILVESNQTSIDDPKYIQLKNDKLKGASTFEHLLRTQKLSALVSIHWLSYAPMFGNPSIVVPAKKLTDDQPKSLVFVGKKWDDATLFTLASAYEKYTKHRIPPVKESYKKS